jgi:hypothetical protein
MDSTYSMVTKIHECRLNVLGLLISIGLTCKTNS